MVTLVAIISTPCPGSLLLSHHLAQQVLALAETIPSPIRGEFFAWLCRHTQGAVCLPDELAPWLDRLPEQEMRDKCRLIVNEILWFRANARAIFIGEIKI